MRELRILCFCALLVAVPILASAEDEYRIGPDDVLRIHVWGRTELDGEVAVDPDGRVRLPLVGEAAAAGLTVTELGRQLAERYTIVDPHVSDVQVSIVQYNSRKITLVGEVRNPGAYGSPAIPTLWELILAAGGANATADLSRVQIVRKGPNAGEPRVITADLSGGPGAAAADSLPALRPLDTVVVPSASAAVVPTGTGVQVLGAVRTPGAYAIAPGQRVLDALAASGGPLPEADLEKVKLTRTTDSGLVSFMLDLAAHFEGRSLDNLDLRAGDSIFVPRRSANIGEFLVRFLLPLASVTLSILVLANQLND